MNRALTIVILAALLLGIFVAPGVAAETEATRYVVVFNSNSVPSDAANTIAKAGGEMAKSFDEIGVAIAISSNANFAKNLEKAKGVKIVGMERYMELAPMNKVEADEPDPAVDEYYYAYQWDIRRVNADQAWDITTGSHDTVVAVLDTGIAWNHPDLAPNVVYATCYSTQPTCSAYPDLHWHGTHVAGTVGAAFGGGRAVGVGPNLGLASYNVFELFFDEDENEWVVVAFDEALWAAMLDVAEKGFDVINMSLGGYYYIPEDGPAGIVAWNRVVDYVRRQGVTIVASAGNGGADLNGPLVHIPGDVTGIINVAATGIRPDPFYPQEGAYDVQAFYSNYGAAVTLASPGGDLGPDAPTYPYWWYFVFSDYVYPDPVCAATASCPIGYAWAAGTSMAAPHVAGAAGLVMDLDPGLNPYQVEARLKLTAENLGDRQQFGHGMLDVFAALSK